MRGFNTSNVNVIARKMINSCLDCHAPVTKTASRCMRCNAKYTKELNSKKLKGYTETTYLTCMFCDKVYEQKCFVVILDKLGICGECVLKGMASNKRTT